MFVFVLNSFEMRIMIMANNNPNNMLLEDIKTRIMHKNILPIIVSKKEYIILGTIISEEIMIKSRIIVMEIFVVII